MKRFSKHQKGSLHERITQAVKENKTTRKKYYLRRNLLLQKSNSICCTQKMQSNTLSFLYMINMYVVYKYICMYVCNFLQCCIVSSWSDFPFTMTSSLCFMLYELPCVKLFCLHVCLCMCIYHSHLTIFKSCYWMYCILSKEARIPAATAAAGPWKKGVPFIPFTTRHKIMICQRVALEEFPKHFYSDEGY